MLIPSIDLMNGEAVQLVGGREKALDAGDPQPLAKRFGRVGEVAVIDLDRALGKGSNEETILKLLSVAKCRVGGGIRDYETAVRWLDAGAAKIILGTKAEPELLRRLPKERTIAALDAVHGEVVVEGWQTKTGRGVEERIAELKPYVGSFLVTFVEREGRLQGIDIEAAKRLRLACGECCELTVAGGVTTAEEIAALDALHIDAQVGMALYTGRIPLAEAFLAPVKRTAEGLYPSVVTDEAGIALGLVWSTPESVQCAIEEGRGVYFSRSRKELWRKGESSGAVQELLAITPDCDRDALRFTVRQLGSGFCHKSTTTCWGNTVGLDSLTKRLEKKVPAEAANEKSYTRRLLSDPKLRALKLIEEAKELSEATTKAEAVWEAADVIYFSLVTLLAHGGSLADVAAELDRRALKVSRRSGEAKIQ